MTIQEMLELIRKDKPVEKSTFNELKPVTESTMTSYNGMTSYTGMTYDTSINEILQKLMVNRPPQPKRQIYSR